MKEKNEEPENKDEDDESLNPIKFESFNISLPEKEKQIPKENKNRILYLLIIIIIILFIHHSFQIIK